MGLIVISRLTFHKFNQNQPHTETNDSHTVAASLSIVLWVVSHRCVKDRDSRLICLEFRDRELPTSEPLLTIFVCCGGPGPSSIVVPSPNFENSISARQAGLSAVDGGNGGGIAEDSARALPPMGL